MHLLMMPLNGEDDEMQTLYHHGISDATPSLPPPLLISAIFINAEKRKLSVNAYILTATYILDISRRATPPPHEGLMARCRSDSLKHLNGLHANDASL